MTKTEYAAYLASEHWQALRSRILEECPNCERCDIPRWLAEIAYDQDLHVHHRTYLRLRAEEDTDLEVLCRCCHEVATFGRSELKAPKERVCGFCWEKHWDPRSPLCATCLQVLTTPYLYHSLEKTSPISGCLLFEEIQKMQALLSAERTGGE